MNFGPFRYLDAGRIVKDRRFVCFGKRLIVFGLPAQMVCPEQDYGRQAGRAPDPGRRGCGSQFAVRVLT